MEVGVDHCERRTNAMKSSGLTVRRPHRQRHCSQRGFTLIELLVASAITAVIALTLGAAIALSVRLVGPQGAEGQLVASKSLLDAERQLSTDVSHAECVITTGSCTGAVAGATCSPGFRVCVAWCEAGSAQAATYSLNGSELRRQGSSGAFITVAREVTSLSFNATPNSSGPQLQVDLVSGTSRPQHARFTVQSLLTGAAPQC